MLDKDYIGYEISCIGIDEHLGQQPKQTSLSQKLIRPQLLSQSKNILSQSIN